MLQYPLFDFITNKKPKQGLITKVFISIHILFYILTYTNEYFIISNSLNAYLIYSKIEITRLLSSLFISESIFALLLNVYFTLSLINYFENTEGSIYFLRNFLFSSIIFQVFLLLIVYIISIPCPYILTLNISPYKYILISYLIKQILTSDGKYIFSYIFKKSNTRLQFVILLICVIFLKDIMNYIINELFIIIFSIMFGCFMAKHEVFFSFKQFNHHFLVLIDNNQVLREFDCFISLNSLLKIRPKFGSECCDKGKGFGSNLYNSNEKNEDEKKYNDGFKEKNKSDSDCDINISIN